MGLAEALQTIIGNLQIPQQLTGGGGGGGAFGGDVPQDEGATFVDAYGNLTDINGNVISTEQATGQAPVQPTLGTTLYNKLPQTAEVLTQPQFADAYGGLVTEDGSTAPTEAIGLQNVLGNTATPVPRSNQATASSGLTQTTQPTTLSGAISRALPTEAQSTLESALAEYNRLKKTDPRSLDKNKDSVWKNMGKQLALGLGQMGQVVTNPNLKDGEAFNMALGMSLGRALTGIVSPYADEQEQLAYMQNKAEKDVGAAQQIYGNDVEARMKETQMQGVQSQIKDREQQTMIDKMNAQTNAKKVEQAGDKTLLNSYEKIYKGTVTFDPVNDKEDKELSDAYARMTGVPLLPKTAGVFKTEAVPDASTGTVYFRTLDKEGKVIGASTGWLKADGTYTSDKTQAGKFQDPYVKAQEINAANRLQMNTDDNRTTLTVTDLQIKSRERLAKAENEDQYVKDELNAFEESLTASGGRDANGNKYTQEQITLVRRNIENKARQDYKNK